MTEVAVIAPKLNDMSILLLSLWQSS